LAWRWECGLVLVVSFSRPFHLALKSFVLQTFLLRLGFDGAVALRVQIFLELIERGADLIE